MDRTSEQQPADTAAALETLLERLADLLAERLLPQLKHATAQAEPPPTSRKPLSLEQLVVLLPTGKSPRAWRSWFYQRTCRGQVPGCVKVGNRLFFDPDVVLPWLLGGAPAAANATGLDPPASQSLHGPAMAHEPTQPAQRGEDG